MGTKTGFHHSTSAQYLLHIKNKIPKRGRKHIVAFAILVHYFNIKTKSPNGDENYFFAFVNSFNYNI